MTVNKNKFSRVKGILVLALVVAAELGSTSVMAQRYFKRYKPGKSRGFSERYSPNTYLGLEGVVGTPAFKFNSDIKEINGLNAVQEGGSAGIVAGSNALTVRLRHGFYYSSATVPQTVNLTSTEGVVNINFLQLISKRQRFIEPYLLTGLDNSTVKMYGFYEAPEKEKVVKEPKEKECHDGHETGLPGDPDANSSGSSSSSTSSGPPSDPDQSTDPDVDNNPVNHSLGEAPYLGKIKVVRGTVGFGLVIHIYGKSSFINLFSEFRYGMAISQKTTSPMFNNTTVKGQPAINVGVSFGLRK